MALSYVHKVTVTARRLVFDAVLALALLTGTEVITVAGRAPSLTPLWLRGLLVAVIVVPLTWRRRAPVVVWGVCSAATAAAIAFTSSPGPGVLAPLVALYTVASRSGRVASMGAGAITLAGCAALAVSGSRSSVVFDDSRIRGDGVLVLAVLVAACWLIGDNLRVRRAYVAELQAKAKRAEADQQAGLARAAAQERARIARELHDVVVHHVSSIAVQAGAARMLADNGASAGEEGPTWSGIEAAARQALSELRQLLGVLRNGQAPPARKPQPGLHDLEQLLEECRQAGLPVQASVDGCRASLPASISLAGYRIIQEALRNVRKHQGCASTSVALRYRASELEIEVSSQRAAGPPPRREGPGHGLVGMHERVTLLGGELDAGPRPDGGFQVTARIPLEGTVA
jgi:signal transduction histidine kinase